MVKRIFSYGFILFVLFAGCTDLFLNDQTDENWLLKKNGKMAVYYRPAGFSNTPSPTDSAVDTMLVNQNYYYTRILDTLKVKFDGVVMVYLYNFDEARNVIGTNGGGHGVTQLLTYHYTYFSSFNSPVLVLGRRDKLGAHELIHILAENTLGPHGTRLFSEGLAVFIDNTYGGKYCSDIMKSYFTSGKFLSVNSLINDDGIEESLFYPNAGTFIKYFTTRFGIEKTKSLFTVPKEDLESAFLRTAGKSIIEIQADYDQYCRSLFQN